MRRTGEYAITGKSRHHGPQNIFLRFSLSLWPVFVLSLCSVFIMALLYILLYGLPLPRGLSFLFSSWMKESHRNPNRQRTSGNRGHLLRARHGGGTRRPGRDLITWPGRSA